MATRNACESVDDKTAILAFIGGLRAGNLLRYNLTCKLNAGTLTLNEMISDACNGAAAEDDARGFMQASAVPGSQSKKGNNNNNNKRKNPPEDNGGGGSDMVAMTFQQRGQGGSRGRGRSSGTSRGQ